MRLVVFLALAGFIYLAPVPHQVFGKPTHGLPRWRMYGGKSLKECAGHFEQVTADGTRRLRWLELLGYSDDKPAPKRARQIVGVKAGTKVAEQLCAKLGPSADVRMHMRCPSFTRGWNIHAKGDKNLCLKPKATP